MGQYSWLDCRTQEQILDNVNRDVYVLVPEEFGGGHIHELCYDGYGHFGGHDIHDLVADWNRIALTEDFEFPHAKKREEYLTKIQARDPSYTEKIDWTLGDKSWAEDYLDLSQTREEVETLHAMPWRFIGIELSCYDDDNAALPYPIKITHDPDAVYELCGPSDSDPNQGWSTDEEEDWL